MVELINIYLIKKIRELNKIKAEDDLTDYGRGKLTVYKEVLDLILNYFGEEEQQ